ncbi:MAG: DUF1877 family protein [Myxococcota bacterium]
MLYVLAEMLLQRARSDAIGRGRALTGTRGPGDRLRMGMQLYVVAAEKTLARAFFEQEDWWERVESPSPDFLVADLDKAWDALRFVLARAREGDDPGAFIYAGGEDVGDDLGYGPARFFDATATAALASSVESIDDDAFDGAFDPAAMTSVYPMVWDEPRADLLEEHLDHFRRLKQVLVAARERGWSLSVAMT